MKEFIKQAIVEDTLDRVELISGKVFDRKTKEEIKDIKKYLANEQRKLGVYILDNDLQTIVKTLYNFNENGLWYELPLVKKARELGAINSQLPFDLDDKQLTIINRMIFHPQDEVMFISTGVGGSGKSTFLNIVKQLYDNDYSSTSLSDLTNSFTIAEAVKHRLICSDELAKGELNLPILKQLISKQDIYVNPKNLTGYEVKSQSALLYCCNTAPKIDVTDTGTLRRIVFYERNTKIKNPNVTLKDKTFTKDELLTILRNSLRFENDLWYNMFEEETHKYLMKNNSVAIFIHCDEYYDYAQACANARLKPYSEPNWREIRALFMDWNYNDIKKYGDKDDNEAISYFV